MNTQEIRTRKRSRGADPLVVVTAYDVAGAHFADAAGVDMVLVGDSLANVVLGHSDTLHLSVDDMARHVAAVAAARPRAHVVADLPWPSYHEGPAQAVRSAAQLVRAGAESVKLEGGTKRAEVVRALLDAEIPVMGHLGLTPQSVLAMGGYRVQARSDDAARTLLEDALVLQESGVYAVVLEGVPTTVGRSVTEVLDIPTIGIGAGPDTDGQVLVFHDLLGLSLGRPAKFVRQYADLGTAITEAIGHYATDVRSGQFPSPAESYGDSSPGSPASE
ncbi:MAG: 3-methyl-2-oxobutanoate hydroxymethyltransferase [Acidobacteria bacterium]|nr:3-methyl-2-oxobutanoate hydroxymethyltransferase [Acidobacteriota bacterium]